jgi:hypothetical protein
MLFLKGRVGIEQANYVVDEHGCHADDDGRRSDIQMNQVEEGQEGP